MQSAGAGVCQAMTAQNKTPVLAGVYAYPDTRRRPVSKTISGDDRIRADSPNVLPGNDLGTPAQVSAAAGAAIDNISAPIDPDLAAVVEAWPGLPESARAAILAIVEGAR